MPKCRLGSWIAIRARRKYIEKMSTGTCPKCGHKVRIGDRVVTGIRDRTLHSLAGARAEATTASTPPAKSG